MQECPFAIGQPVFIATAHALAETEVPCPVCNAKRCCLLRLGSGEEVWVECEFCAHGCERPSGFVKKRGPDSKVEEREVTGFVWESGTWRVHVSGGYPDSHRLTDGNIFASREEAESRRVELHAGALESARRNFEAQFVTAKKKVTWSAGYHRAQIKDLERKLAWHRERLAAPSLEPAHKSNDTKEPR